MPLKFVTGEPALMTGRTLVIADLHVGAEHDYRAAGISMPSQSRRLEAAIKRLVSRTRAERLIILGDVKHRVPGASFQEEREVPELLERLAGITNLRSDGTRIQSMDVEVVPGNHDGGLKKLCPSVTIHPSEGIMVGDAYLSHGHAWPGEEALHAKSIVIGHSHPQVEFRDRLGKVWRERAWVKAKLGRKALSGHYRNVPKALPGLVIMPSFSGLVGGWAVNRKPDYSKPAGGLGPLVRCAELGRAKLYMLDGTFLGEACSIQS